VFEVPVTLALKSCVPTVGTEALVGLMLNKTAAAATIVTFAKADFVGSDMLVAFTLTAAGDGTVAGATNNPLLEIVPHTAPVQPTPLTDQVTAVFELPDTFPANCWVLPAINVAMFGVTVIATGVALTVSVAVLLFALPFELLIATVNALPLSEIVVTGEV
jgi:hypothetical protein